MIAFGRIIWDAKIFAKTDYAGIVGSLRRPLFHYLMITLGIDLLSAKKNTVACVIEWEQTRAVVRPPERKCDDEKLKGLIADSTVVGN